MAERRETRPRSGEKNHEKAEKPRRQTASRDKRRREKQIRTRAAVISAVLVLAVTAAAYYGAVRSGRPLGESGQTAETESGGRPAEAPENGSAADDDEAKAGKMRGSIAFAKKNADNPDDVDGDGIANRQDIFQSAKEYVATKPSYESRYYQGGYPDDGYGVCTDVVGFAFLGAGFDLRMLVKADIEAHMEEYPEMERPDPKIDFRRVQNLEVFFQHTAEVLTTDLSDPDQWLPGDIVTWERHIGIISDRKNERGVPYVLHHAGPGQKEYEEDILEGKSHYSYVREITGHYRVS